MDSSMTWQELYDEALAETQYAYREHNPEKDEFLRTFKTFYDELSSTRRISTYPYDPPGSRRAAISRATEVWADDFSPKL